MIDDKGHHPGIAVMCRPRGQSEPTDHLAADDVVGRTAFPPWPVSTLK
jgi:hypothetical protein